MVSALEQVGAESHLEALESWKGWGGLGSLERTHRMLEGRSEVDVVVCNGGNFSSFVWVQWVRNLLTGCTEVVQAIGGY